MREGDEISVGTGEDENEYRCMIEKFEDDRVICKLLFVKEANVELPAKVILYQCLPKADKMEMIIQKCVELGVSEIIPVASKRCVVKLDDKKASSKIARWQSIAEAAGKQSKRAIVPFIGQVTKFSEALKDAERADVKIIPYELCEGMEDTKEVFKFFEFPEKKDGKEIVTPTEILDGFPYIQGWRMATEPDLENDEDVFGSAFLCMSNARFYPLEELPTYCNYISIILKDLEKYTETFKSCKDIHDTIVNNEVNSDPVFLYEYAVQYLKQYIRLMLRVIKSFVKEGTYILDFIPEELNLLMDKALYFESAFRKIISNYPQKTFVFSECIAD